MGISTAVDPSAVARVLGIETKFVRREGGVQLLPQRVALIAQGSTSAVYSTDKRTVQSALEAGQVYGFGSPIHLAAKALLPAQGGGIGSIPLTVYPLVDDGSGVAAAGSISGVGSQVKQAAYRVRINNIVSNAFVIAAAQSFSDVANAVANAINAVVDMPVTAFNNLGTVELTAKWKGATGNEIAVEMLGEEDGITFTVVQPTGGLVDPDIQPALDQFGSVWETLVVSQFYSATALNKMQTFGDGRWGALVRKPLVSFIGTSETDDNGLAALGDSRRTDRVNCILTAPGSNDLFVVIAAALVAQIARQANRSPAVDYGSLPATPITAGSDGVQFDYNTRDFLVKAGISTTEVKDGVVNLSDTVTMYHPEGDPNPAYRYVVDIVKLQNIIFNMDLIFAGKPWDGAPLIPDNQPTRNRDARKPKDAKAALATLTDFLGLEAIISDPEGTKPNIITEIDSGNPKRLNGIYPVNVSGNANIISLDLEFSFFFGG